MKPRAKPPRSISVTRAVAEITAARPRIDAFWLRSLRHGRETNAYFGSATAKAQMAFIEERIFAPSRAAWNGK